MSYENPGVLPDEAYQSISNNALLIGTFLVHVLT